MLPPPDVPLFSWVSTGFAIGLLVAKTPCRQTLVPSLYLQGPPTILEGEIPRPVCLRFAYSQRHRLLTLRVIPPFGKRLREYCNGVHSDPRLKFALFYGTIRATRYTVGPSSRGSASAGMQPIDYWQRQYHSATGWSRPQDCG